jgi:predicted 3-demethylubiquinone-9 3-methyltransferase (glyoxalase superfamily)
MKKLFAALFLFSIAFSGVLKGQTVNEQDSLTLVALYNATNGDYWKDNTNWLTDKWGAWYATKAA